MEEITLEQVKLICKKIQDFILENKKNKGFNLTNVPLEFCYLSGEVAEAFSVWKKNKDDLDEELADIAIYCFGLASILGIDLGTAITKKMTKNIKRTYINTEHGLEKIPD